MKIHKSIKTFATMIISLFFSIVLIQAANAYILRDGDRTYIVDRTGEKWNITQAKAIGFERGILGSGSDVMHSVL
jgi:hypothetical protein